MNPSKNPNWLLHTGALLCLASGSAFAQSVLAPPPPEFSEMVPEYTGNVTAETRQAAARPRSENDPLFRWGPVNVRPHPFYRFSYGDGIQARPGEDYTTAIHEFAPGVLFEIGDIWRLDYTPTIKLYSSDQFNDSTDHSVALAAGTMYEDWSFGFSQSYVSTSDVLAETATQTDRDAFVTGLSAARQLNSDWSLQLSANQSFQYADQYSDSKTWSTLNWLNYQYHPDLAFAIGGGGGFTAVSQGFDMTFEQLQGRIIWQAGDKLAFVLNGGVDFRQFLDTDAPTLINPIYGLSAVYELFEPTTLTLSGERAVDASLFSNQVTESTSISASVRQRLLEKLFLTVSGGLSTVSYVQVTPDQPISREDDRWSFTTRLGTSFLKRGSASVFYNLSKQISDREDFEYSSQQVGLELGYRW